MTASNSSNLGYSHALWGYAPQSDRPRYMKGYREALQQMADNASMMPPAPDKQVAILRHIDRYLP